jgi:hypothetical protein
MGLFSEIGGHFGDFIAFESDQPACHLQYANRCLQAAGEIMCKMANFWPNLRIYI